MTKMAALAAWLIVLLAHTASARGLDIVFIDVEGGQATLIVTPAGESLLIDAGYTGRGGRDADRILAAVRDAGVTRIDYLVVTHFHNDHVGGVPDLAARIPIGTFVDYGAPLGTPLGADRLSGRPFEAYEPTRATGRHLVVRPGDRLPLQGVDVTVISSGGALVDASPLGTDTENPACGGIEDQSPDGTENYRSVGIVVRFGAFGSSIPAISAATRSSIWSVLTTASARCRRI
jgi:competence protein ComEC